MTSNNNYLKDVIYLTLLRQKLDGSVFDADFCQQPASQRQAHHRPSAEPLDSTGSPREEQVSLHSTGSLCEEGPHSCADPSSAPLQMQDPNRATKLTYQVQAPTLFDRLESRPAQQQQQHGRLSLALEPTGQSASSKLKLLSARHQNPAQLKRKRAKLVDHLLNTNWAKKSAQSSNLIKLHKIVLLCQSDLNFLDEKTGLSPISLAISSQQINQYASKSCADLNASDHLHEPAASDSSNQSILRGSLTKSRNSFNLFSGSGGNSSSSANNNNGSCPQSASLFNLQAASILSASQLNPQANSLSVTDLSLSKAPLIERVLLLLIKSGAGHLDFRNSDGKTPLHLAAIKSNIWALKTLLELGAATDIRDINGLTPLYYAILHRADLKVAQLLLNYSRPNLTSGGSVMAAEQPIGCKDQHGWQEVHQACKLGLSGHLEKLLYYGCDIDAKIEGSGNTPLHVAAINDQLECAKVLMLRGADKELINNSHQTAHQVAVVSQNMDLAEFIAEFQDSRRALFRDRPANYLDMSRPTGANQTGQAPRLSVLVHPQPQAQAQSQQSHLNEPLSLDLTGTQSSSLSNSTSGAGCGLATNPSSLLSSAGQPQSLLSISNQQASNISPCLSQRSFGTHSNATTSSSGVCCDETGRQLANSHQANVSVVAIGGGGGGGGGLSNNLTGFRPVDEETQDNFNLISSENQQLVSNSSNRKRQDLNEPGNNGSDDESNYSSEGSSSQSSNGLYSLISDERPLFVGTIVEAVSDYQSGDPSHLQLKRGDLVEILKCADELLLPDGSLPKIANKPMLFGVRKSDSQRGLFPSFCVHRAHHRHHHRSSGSKRNHLINSQGGGNRRTSLNMSLNGSNFSDCNSSSILTTFQQQQQRGVTSALPESQSMSLFPTGNSSEQSLAAPTTAARKEFRKFQVTLTKTRENGFGFVLRGAKIDPQTLSSSNVIDEKLMLANNLVSLQYLDEIEPNSNAHRVGLKRGDFLVAVNEQDVRLSSHEQVVHMIRQSGDQVQLTIATPITVTTPTTVTSSNNIYSSKTLGRVKPEPPKRDPSTTLTRNQAQRVKSMMMQQSMSQSNFNNFDANKPLPVAPSMKQQQNNNNYYNLLDDSASNNSATNCNGSICETQSITSSISAMSIMNNNNNSSDNHSTSSQHQSSASSTTTTTQTTVAHQKPQVLPKPTLAGSAYQPAVIKTTPAGKQKSSPKASPSVANSVDPMGALPPPPPPPLPDFSSPKMEQNRISQRRTSVPANNHMVPAMMIDAKQLMKKRESLATIEPRHHSASQIAPPNQFGAVAAACAAAANNRLQRQQLESNKTNSGQSDEKRTSQPEDESPSQQQQVEPKKVPDEPVTGDARSLPTLAEEKKCNEQEVVVKKDEPAKVIIRTPYKQAQSATLGRKSSAQIIQQTKQQSNSTPSSAQMHSQTLKVSRPKQRPAIPSYEPELPPPPPPLPMELEQQQQHNHHHQNHHRSISEQEQLIKQQQQQIKQQLRQQQLLQHQQLKMQQQQQLCLAHSVAPDGHRLGLSNQRIHQDHYALQQHHLQQQQVMAGKIHPHGGGHSHNNHSHPHLSHQQQASMTTAVMQQQKYHNHHHRTSQEIHQHQQQQQQFVAIPASQTMDAVNSNLLAHNHHHHQHLLAGHNHHHHQHQLVQQQQQQLSHNHHHHHRHHNQQQLYQQHYIERYLPLVYSTSNEAER